MSEQRHGKAAGHDGPPRPPTVDFIICWNCSREIPLHSAGDYCPHFGTTLSERAYDERAGELLREMSDLGTQIGRTSEQLVTARRRNERLGPLRNLPFLPSHKLVASLEFSLIDMRRETQRISSTLKQLATARYYASSWHHLTGWPLCDLGKPGSSPFGTPRYALGRKGMARFTCKATKYPKRLKERLEASYAEYETFCKIQRIVDDGSLGYARLLANLVICYDDDERQRYNKHVRAHEVDAVLITERSIIVIETKRTWMDVTADYDPRQGRHRVIRTKVDKDGTPFGVEQADGSVSQVVAHCHTLSRTGTYSVGPESLEGLIVYAGTPHLKVRCEQGSGTPAIYLASLEGNGPTLEEMLREAVCSHEVERSAAEVDAVADELFARYADLDGSKLQAHRERIARDAVIRSVPSATPKKRALGAPSNDEELERMIAELRLD